MRSLVPALLSVLASPAFAVGGPTSSPFCFGNGGGTACPCGNAGASGNGCANSVIAAGANLAATGNASVGADTFVLHGTGMPNGPCLYFQGTTRVDSGNGMLFGDGLRCAGGAVRRLRTKLNVGNASICPGPGDPPISVAGAVTAAGLRTYQGWYRNGNPGFCTAATFNLTNGFETVWSP